MKKYSFISLWCALMVSAFSLTEEELNSEQRSQTSTAYSILFDNSGSMAKDGKITQAKQAFSAWLSAQDPKNAYSLIHFTDGGTVAVPLQNDTLERAQQVVGKLQPGGQTPIVNCLKLAHENIKARRGSFSPYERHIVVVFTDGYESLDRDGNRGVVNAIHKLTADGIEVTGIGFHGQGEYMNAAATQYFDAYNTEELKSSLDKVSAEIDPNAEIEMSAEDDALLTDLDVRAPLVEKATYISPEEKSTNWSRWIFFLVIGLFIVPRVLKKIF